MKDVGTLAEIGARVGDVITDDHVIKDVTVDDLILNGFRASDYRIVSRAGQSCAPNPTTEPDMTHQRPSQEASGGVRGRVSGLPPMTDTEMLHYVNGALGAADSMHVIGKIREWIKQHFNGGV